jgi:hypothetical protein
MPVVARVNQWQNVGMTERLTRFDIIVDTRPRDGWEVDAWAIRHRFRALRKKARLTQRRLGVIISLCRQSVSEIENGHVICHHSTWARFQELERKHNRPRIEFPTHWD